MPCCRRSSPAECCYSRIHMSSACSMIAYDLCIAFSLSLRVSVIKSVYYQFSGRIPKIGQGARMAEKLVRHTKPPYEPSPRVPALPHLQILFEIVNARTQVLYANRLSIPTLVEPRHDSFFFLCNTSSSTDILMMSHGLLRSLVDG